MHLFMNLLDQIIESKNYKEIDAFVKENVVSFFDSPFLTKYYQKLKPFQLESNESKLVVAWLAFLSGDNMAHYEGIMSICFDDLTDQMKALYLDLKSISKLFGSLDERYELSLKSLHYSEQEVGFFRANSLSIHANLIFLKGKHREAANLFEKAFQIFFRDKLYFQASVALSNELIILTRFGDFNDVIAKAKHILMLTSEFQSDDKIYWESIYLPLGMVYLMQNKPALSLECLKKAEAAIDLMQLVHMHGNLEIYLIKNYLLSKDFNSITKLIDKTCKAFEHTLSPTIEIVISFGKIVANHPNRKIEIERVEELFYSSSLMRPLITETIAYATNHGLVKIDYFEQILKVIENARYTGDLLTLQTALLFLAEYYYKKEDFNAARILLEEAIDYYHKKQIKAPFYMYEYKCYPLITKIDKKIISSSANIDKNHLLTQKELDILTLMAQGKNNEDIGKTIFISVGTVKWHINHILSKLDVKNRMQAVEKAKSLHLID
jgi:LuxR family transcriptional regulator, maltose regulon positive regulatory protein